MEFVTTAWTAGSGVTVVTIPKRVVEVKGIEKGDVLVIEIMTILKKKEDKETTEVK